MPRRENNRCRRGHLLEGDNVKRRPSTPYVACKACERIVDKRRKREGRA